MGDSATVLTSNRADEGAGNQRTSDDGGGWLGGGLKLSRGQCLSVYYPCCGFLNKTQRFEKNMQLCFSNPSYR